MAKGKQSSSKLRQYFAQLLMQARKEGNFNNVHKYAHILGDGSNSVDVRDYISKNSHKQYLRSHHLGKFRKAK